MKRQEFLGVLGAGTLGVICSACLGGCSNPDDSSSPSPAPTGVDFTLDLTAPENSALTADGGEVYHSGIVVARVSSNQYVAVSSTCTHAGGTVQYQGGPKNFYCPNHGSRFGLDGSVVNGPATRPLTTYIVEVSGNSLRVHS